MLDPTISARPSPPAPVSVLPWEQAAPSALQASQCRAEMLAVAIEIQSALEQTDRLSEAGSLAVRLLGEYLAAKRMLIVWRRPTQSTLEVLADSDQRGDAVGHRERRLVEAAGEEIAGRDGLTLWPPNQPNHRHALMAVAQLATAVGSNSLVGVRLIDADGQTRGAVLAIDPVHSAAPFLDALGPALTNKLAGIQRRQPSRLETAVQRLVAHAGGSKRKISLALVVGCLLLMTVPIRYRIGGELELQPVQRRFVAVGLDGPLQSSRVRPGDTVVAGETLAIINPREIDYEMASVRAELHQAEQQKLGLMAEHDFAGSKIAALESERLRLQADLLEYQRANLEIRSPLSGVVVSGDWQQSEGIPMTRGETLFEIAPLGEMLVEIALPENEFSYARCGMPVEFYVHALPDRAMTGTLQRIHPRAELRDGDNVFVAEVRVTDPDHLLRPGMRGRAKIIGDRYPLGWNLFHKAYFAARNLMGW